MKQTTIKRLEKQLTTLQNINATMKHTEELRNNLTQSGFSGLAGIFGGPQTAMASFNNLAYFSIYQPITINWTMLSFMYKTHGLLQTAIDMPVWTRYAEESTSPAKKWIWTI